jgi:hypothetical protein
MPSDVHVTGISHIIQLAVAPVFLLSGIGTMLALVGGLICFLHEITLATANLPAGPQR